MVQVASRIAVAEGLDKVTAKRIAAELSVFPGLVAHYFSADELVAAAFACAAAAERDEVFDRAESAGDPVAQIRALLADWLHTDRDSVSLLWLDAWQASRRRPALLAEVDRQMQLDLVRLTHLIDSGITTGDFAGTDAASAAMQIMSLIDGLSVQAVVRGILDYAAVRAMVITITEQLLHLDAGQLSLDAGQLGTAGSMNEPHMAN